MALASYAVVAIAVLLLTKRFIAMSKIAMAILFLLPFVFVGHALVTSRVYGPVDHPYASQPLNWMKEEYGIGEPHNALLSDLYGQMIPWRKAVQVSLAHGEWPLWNPFILSGDILAPSGQPAPYSPLTLLALLLPVPIGLTFSAALVHFIAALGAFLFAREIGCREPAALIAAAGWSCATSIVLFVLWPLGAAWSLFPLVMFRVRRASLAMLTGAFTLLLLAGHPETALHIVAIVAVYALVLRDKRVIMNGVYAGIFALALSAIFILPILEAAPQTMEHVTRTGAFASSPRGVSSEQVLARIATDLFPYLHARAWTFGTLPIDTAATGSIILALAIFGAARVRSRESWFFAGLAIFGLLAHAEWMPLARLLQKLPLFDQTLNERFSFAAAFALAMLAALGVEDLLAGTAAGRRPLSRRDGGVPERWRPRRLSRRRLAAVLALAIITIGNVWLTRAPFVDHAPLQWGRWIIAAEIAGLALAIVAIILRAPYALLAILLLQRALSAGGIYHSFEQRAAYPPIPIFANLKEGRITGHGLAFFPGTSALYGLEDVRGYQAMTFLRHRETYPLWSIHQPVWFNRVDDLTRPFLSFLNVRYAITWDRDPPPDGWIEAARQKGTLLLENTRVIERVFVPRRVRIGSSNTLAEMQNETDFRERAWIEAAMPAHERVNGPGTVRFTHGISEYRIDAEMQNDGWIVASLPAWNGWRAYVDGHRIETHFANHAFLGIPVPRGNHHVRLVFLPRSFVIGRGISFAALALAIGMTIRCIRVNCRANTNA